MSEHFAESGKYMVRGVSASLGCLVLSDVEFTHKHSHMKRKAPVAKVVNADKRDPVLHCEDQDKMTIIVDICLREATNRGIIPTPRVAMPRVITSLNIDPEAIPVVTGDEDRDFCRSGGG